MPTFRDTTTTIAAPDEVWKILYDPSRFPEWWAGIGTVDLRNQSEYTMYPDGCPDFPMPQALRTSRNESRVVVSCLVSDLRFEWRLEAASEGTRITVDVEIPEREAHRLDGQREVIASSLTRLAQLASAA